MKLLCGKYVISKKTKSLIVSDQAFARERLGDFFKHIAKAAKKVGKKLLNNPGEALELAASIGSEAASKNPKPIIATARNVIKFVHHGKGFYLGKIHCFIIYLFKYIFKSVS